MVRVLDPALGGRAAYGAEILVEAGGNRRWGLAQPSISYLVSDDHRHRVHFGLGPAAVADAIRVLWPDGAEELFDCPGVDREITFHKRTGKKP